MRRLRTGLIEALHPEVDPREHQPRVFEQLDAVDAEYLRGARFRQQVTTSRYVDSYLTYVTEMVAALLIKDPRALRSNEQVRISDVLSHERMDGFIEWLAEDRINRLSFKGFGEISDYVQERLGLPLLKDGDLKQRIVGSIATRNLLVHRRGVVDRRYIESMSREGLSVEGLVPGTVLGEIDALATVVAILEAVAHFEDSATAKFDLEQSPLELS